MTDHDNPYSAGIYDSGSRSLGAARLEANAERLKAALAAVDKYADCGDNSCLFKHAQRRGAGTNGGCRCRERPFVMAALAELVRAARAAVREAP